MTSKTIERPPAGDAEAARSLLTAAAVRDASRRLLALALRGELEDWRVDSGRLAPTADFVAGIVRERYPRLDVPLHSRWRHLPFGAARSIIAAGSRATTGAEARSDFDLVITSVLLDAGAGPAWTFKDAASGRSVGRSEGLALASLRWFERGGLSDDAAEPGRADAVALRRVDVAMLESAFQVDSGNPLVGLDGRVELLNRLGVVVEARPDVFAIADSPRPGGLFDALEQRAQGGRLPATVILDVVLDAFGPIWKNRPSLAGIPLGDCWPHPALAAGRPESGFAPLHKLSQWLSYSLVEPLQRHGIRVTDLQELTGLAEYRNGGLFVDMGVLTPRDPAAATHIHQVSDPFVVGWRALTVALLDELAPMVRRHLGLAPDRFPLGCVLEGGTWAAGRDIARRTRDGGGPPFHIQSDGTVF